MDRPASTINAGGGAPVTSDVGIEMPLAGASG
jgi:hypothetical protein